MGVTIQIDDHSKEFLNALEERLPIALEACGYRMEELAVGYCAVDTGLLRNSITFALDGESPQKKRYTADKQKGGQKASGSYAGQAPKEVGKGIRSVYVGTNVEYAIFVEKGTSRQKAQPFISRSIKGHGAEYEQILKRYLQNG